MKALNPITLELAWKIGDDMAAAAAVTADKAQEAVDGTLAYTHNPIQFVAGGTDISPPSASNKLMVFMSLFTA
jgi:hypothetical protein